MSYTVGAYVDAVGTSLQGHVEATKYELEHILGLADYDVFDEDKTSTEWTLLWDDGLVSTVYDYYTRATYFKPYRWHIGGKNAEVVHRVQALVDAHRKANAHGLEL